LTHDAAQVELAELLDLFYEHAAAVGEFLEVEPTEVPPLTRSLLNHEQHMTVTVERFHRCAVDVRVLRFKQTEEWYAREIVLERTTDRGVVQYGIVRLNLSLLADSVRNEILAADKPLGRVLIEHDVLRSVRLLSLQRIVAGPVLKEALGIEEGTVCYGRTAVIFCDEQPAIQLLEVVPAAG
jgi:chorismate-pyruvate lyase